MGTVRSAGRGRTVDEPDQIGTQAARGQLRSPVSTGPVSSGPVSSGPVQSPSVSPAPVSVSVQRMVGGAPGAPVAAGDVLHLQRLAGNQATAQLLSGGTGGDPLLVQRTTRPSRRGRETSKAREARLRREAKANASSWTWGGLASSLWGMVSGGISSENEGGSSEREEESSWGAKEEEEEKSLFEVPKLVIEIPEAEFEHQFLDGAAKSSGSGSGKVSLGLDGIEAEGEGEIKVQLGLEGSLETGDLSYKMSGGELSGKGELKAFIGHRGELSGELGASGEGVTAKGKIAAFSGMSVEGETEITVKVGERELGTFKGSLGAAVGVGGELSGHISFKGGTLRYGSKGKMAAGAGFTWAYEFEIHVAPLSTGIFSWLGTLGAAAHEFLTDADGEPLHL